MKKTTTARKPARVAPEVFQPRRILVPLDFSELSSLALGHAVAVAEQHASVLLLLHVVEPIIYPVDFAVVPREMQDANVALVKNARERMAALQEELSARGLKVETDVRSGRPHAEITEVAAKKKIDLIVLPTHGRKGLKAIYLGSTAEKVVRHAPCSVLVVR